MLASAGEHRIIASSSHAILFRMCLPLASRMLWGHGVSVPVWWRGIGGSVAPRGPQRERQVVRWRAEPGGSWSRTKKRTHRPEGDRGAQGSICLLTSPVRDGVQVSFPSSSFVFEHSGGNRTPLWFFGLSIPPKPGIRETNKEDTRHTVKHQTGVPLGSSPRFWPECCITRLPQTVLEA